MNNYDGIFPKDIDLLCENRYMDSKSFYEDHKEQLKQGITIPLRQMVLDMSDTLYEIDEKMFTDPVRSVSRIYRDTRGNRSKVKYRENMWVFFRRYKKQYPSAPFYYFELFPDSFGFGLVFWTWKPSLFKIVHKKIVENPKRFLNALKNCEDAGMVFNCRDMYKKMTIECDINDIQPYLYTKNMAFSYSDSDMSIIQSDKIIELMKDCFIKVKPMYDIFIEAYEEMLEEGLIKPEFD